MHASDSVAKLLVCVNKRKRCAVVIKATTNVCVGLVFSRNERAPKTFQAFDGYSMLFPIAAHGTIRGALRCDAHENLGDVERLGHFKCDESIFITVNW